jgi:hypothetical protein
MPGRTESVHSGALRLYLPLVRTRHWGEHPSGYPDGELWLVVFRPLAC